MKAEQSRGINENGHLTLGGIDSIKLAEEFGTPLIVMDEDQIRENARIYKKSIDDYYGGRGIALYASKAFCCVAACRLAKEEGLGLDVVSGGELYTAIKAEFPAEKICFHGNNKTAAELEAALNYGVGRIVLDNADELLRLSKVASRLNKTADCLIRITPGVDAHTHDFIATGKIDSKFGTPIEKGAALRFIGEIINTPNIKLHGVHCHIGSQIFELEPFRHTANIMLNFLADIRDKYEVTLTELNLGGGFGIKYVEGDDPVDYDQYIKSVAEVLKDACEKRSFPLPFVYMEPGRSLVGATGTTLYTAGSVKTIEGIRTYVSIDGGMTDNPRYALYGSSYEVVCANKYGKQRDMKATIAGRCCESGDLIQENVMLPACEAGDIIAVFSTGAYNYSMASNYNRVPRPEVVFISGGSARTVIRRETYEDITSLDV